MTSFTVAHTTPSGNTLTYTVRGLTRRNWEVTAGHTGVTRKYNGKQAVRGFLNRLADHLDAKYPAIEAGESVAVLVAVGAVQYAH